MAEVFVVVGVQSRQDYFTSNNRLLQSIGASKLMDEAIRDLQSRGGRHIYTGGGNAAVVYADVEEARAALGNWSLHWLERAPRIRLAAGLAEIHAGPAEAWQQARNNLAANEEAGSYGCELPALPVTAYCPDTGLAAQEYDRYHKGWKGSEAIAKEREGREANNRLHDPGQKQTELETWLCRDIAGKGFRFPLDLAELGMPAGARHIAVLHCDGNGIGALMKSLQARVKNLKSLDFDERVGEFSTELSRVTNKAILKTFVDIRDRIPAWRSDKVLAKAPRGEQGFFPARLLVSAGDDVTWICAAPLGIGSALRYCRYFMELGREFSRRFGPSERPLTACAGVAIVPVGFPFRRAYELAEELCGRAKKEHRDKRKEQEHVSLIDVHAITEGSTGSIEQIREHLYRPSLRGPIAVDTDDSDGSPRFESNWRHLHGWPRSRAKKLLEELAIDKSRGEECAQLFASQGYELPLGQKPEDCFPALELLDWHVEWEGGDEAGD